MATKNPAAIPIANSVSNMIDPPHSTPTAGALLSFSILAALWLARRFLPLRLLELYRRAMTLPPPDHGWPYAVSAFANCGRAIAHVRGRYVPHPDSYSSSSGRYRDCCQVEFLQFCVALA